MRNFRKERFKNISKNFLIIFMPPFFIFSILSYIIYFSKITSDSQKKWGIIVIYLVTIIGLSLLGAYIKYKEKAALKGLQISLDIFENSREAIIITDSNTNIIYVNNSFSHITGFSKEEVRGLKTSAFKSGKHDKNFYTRMWGDINQKGRWQGEIWDRRKGNRIYPKFLTIITIKDDDGVTSGYIGIFDDLSDIKNKEERIDRLKNYDLVTSLPNSILMKKLFNEKISILQYTEKHNIYLLSIVINNYDTIKNIVGIIGIDNLIVQFANRMKQISKKEITLSRTQNDEFIIFIQNRNNIKDVLQFANEIINSLKDFFLVEKNKIYLKISIGISSYPNDSDNIDELIEKANIARAYALEEGQGNVVVYKDEYKLRYLKKLKMENLLRGALERGEIYLNYQPQVQLEGEKIVGGEALVRWKNPEFGNIPPNVFIPIAENSDMIIIIGEWVLEEACKKISLWRKKYIKDICIAVNISPVQFRKSNMYITIEKLLKKYNIPGECLEIEITEGVLMENIKDIQEQLKSIKALGVRVAMDDFGTGYSSLSYLRKFNFDKVKIDREFVKDYPEKEDGTIAKIIINLSHSLKLRVIAEGVETEEQIRLMKENFCDEIQGYYYSPPVTEEEFEKLLKKNLFKLDFI